MDGVGGMGVKFFFTTGQNHLCYQMVSKFCQVKTQATTSDRKSSNLNTKMPNKPHWSPRNSFYWWLMACSSTEVHIDHPWWIEWWGTWFFLKNRGKIVNRFGRHTILHSTENFHAGYPIMWIYMFMFSQVNYLLTKYISLHKQETNEVSGKDVHSFLVNFSKKA